jgi:hypothetical protein
VPDDVDDHASALCPHDRKHLAAAADLAEEFQRQALLPVAFGELEEVPALGGPERVHQDVDSTELGHHGAHETRRFLRPGAVGLNRERHAAAGADGVRGRLQRFLSARAEGHMGPLPREAQRCGTADPQAPAGDEPDLRSESEIHRKP